MGEWFADRIETSILRSTISNIGPRLRRLGLLLGSLPGALPQAVMGRDVGPRRSATRDGPRKCMWKMSKRQRQRSWLPSGTRIRRLAALLCGRRDARGHAKQILGAPPDPEKARRIWQP